MEVVFGGRASILCAVMLITISMMPFVSVLVPEEASASTPHDSIYINGNDEFTEENGVSGGTGTPEDPYVIEGWEIYGSIGVRDTNASFVLRNVEVSTSYGTTAISLYDVSHFSISDCVLGGGGNGLFVFYSHDFRIAANTITCGFIAALGSNTMLMAINCEDFEVRDNVLSNVGLFGAKESTDFLFSGNEVHDSYLTLRECTEATIIDNTIAKGVDLQGTSLEHFDSFEMSGNTAGGYEILYVLNEDSKTISNANLGQVIAVNCSNVTISRIDFNNASGACVYFSGTVSITDCEILRPTTGVLTYNCSAVSVERCLIREATIGIRADRVHTVSVNQSLLDKCWTSVRLDAEDAVIRSNMIRDSGSAIGFEMILTAEIYSNNFVNVTNPMVYYLPGYAFDYIVWNQDYPTGGNYWDDYNGSDEFSGPDQDQPGADGLGDTAYIEGIVIDQYPLMVPYAADFGPASEDEEDTDDWIPLIMAMAAVGAIACIIGFAVYAGRKRGRFGQRPPE